MTSPVDLTEALGVTPLFHLIPKQDLAPLLSFSRLDPAPIRLSTYLPDASVTIAEAVEAELNNVTTFTEDSVAFFVNKFRQFDDPDVHDIKFMKPVILGHSDRIPESPVLGPLYKAILNAQDGVDELDLTEPAADIADIPVENEVQLLQSWNDEHEVRQHILRYKEIFERDYKGSSLKRSVSPLNPKSFPRKRAKIDPKQLGDHREAEFYAAVEELDSQNIGTCDVSSKAFLANWVHKVARTIAGLSSNILHIDIEDLQRVQYASVNLIKINLSLPFLSVIVLELLSACEILLTVMNSGGYDRRLHIGSYIESIIDTIDLLVKTMEQNMHILDGATLRIGHCIDSLGSYLSTTKADELVITRLEYISVGAVFSDSNIEDSEVVRNALINLMVQIFKSYDTQRQFIVNEMLLNFKRLPHLKASARHLRLKTGINVLFFTVFLLRLVQSFNGLSVTKEVKAFLKLPKSENRHSATTFKRTALIKSFLGIYDDSVKIANQIAEFFFQDITSADAHFRIIFSIFIEDLLALLPRPDWSGSLTMLESLLRTLMVEFKSNKLSGQIEPFVLEIMGKIGHEIFVHKHNLKLTLVYDANNSDSLTTIATYHNMILQELQNLSQDLLVDQEFQYMLLKFLRLSEVIQSKVATTEEESHIFALMPENNGEQKLLEVNGIINRHIDDLMVILSKGSLLSKIQSVKETSSMTKIYMIITLGESFEGLYEQYFSILISSLESSKAKVATKAIKLLSPLIDIDTKILMRAKVNQSISGLLTGNSPLSRDAVIDLLGKYISDSSELTQKYCKAICERAADTSVLVRRRVINLMPSMYRQCLDVDTRGYIALQLLKHVNDVDRIVSDAAKNHLTEVWFTSNVALPNTCEVMAWTVNSGSAAKNQLQLYLSLKCSLLDRDMRFKVKRISEISLSMIIEEIDTDRQPFSVQKLQLLATLVGWDRRLLNYDQFLLLQPYLFDDREPGDDVCLVILRIFKLMLKDNRNIGREALIKLRHDLIKNLTKLDVRELHEAVPVIQLLSELLMENSSMANAMLSCMKMLGRMFHERFSENTGKTLRCCKLLHLLGCIGAYCDLEPTRMTIQQANVGLLANESVVSLIMKYLIHFSKPDLPESVRIASIRNVIGVAAYHPKIFLSEVVLNLLDQVFASDLNTAKSAAVEGLNQFLNQEDERSAGDMVEVNSSTVNFDKANFHGALQNMHEGVCASVIQRFLEPILIMCLQDSSDSTLIPVQFLRLVIKLGYANPKVCISTVIALEASTNKIIKKIATELHTELFEKHESLTDRNYTESFKLAVQLAKRSRGENFLGEISFLRSVYKVVNRTYLSKKRFILSLAKLFNLDMTQGLQKSMEQRDCTVFLAINLLVVNFTSVEEVCLCLYHLDRSITVDGIDLADRIENTVRSNSGSGMSVENLQLMFLHAQSVLALIYLRQLLATAYGIDASVMDTFRPSRPDVELRQAPSTVLVVDYPLDELDMQTGLGHPGAFGRVFTRLVFSIKNYTT